MINPNFIGLYFLFFIAAPHFQYQFLYQLVIATMKLLKETTPKLKQNNNLFSETESDVMGETELPYRSAQ